jgi:hypothetical protein
MFVHEPLDAYAREIMHQLGQALAQRQAATF